MRPRSANPIAPKARPVRRYRTQHVAVIKRGNALVPYRRLETIIAGTLDGAKKAGRDRCLELIAEYGDAYVFWAVEERPAIRYVPQRKRTPRHARAERTTKERL